MSDGMERGNDAAVMKRGSLEAVKIYDHLSPSLCSSVVLASLPRTPAFALSIELSSALPLARGRNLLWLSWWFETDSEGGKVAVKRDGCQSQCTYLDNGETADVWRSIRLHALR